MFVSKAIFLSFTELPSDIALALTFSYKRSETAAPCSKKNQKKHTRNTKTSSYLGQRKIMKIMYITISPS